MFVLFVDNFINQLNIRFLNHKSVFDHNLVFTKIYIGILKLLVLKLFYFIFNIRFECLFHSSWSSKDRLEFQKLVEFYLPLVEKDNAFVELRMWKMKISNGDVSIKNWLEALYNYNKEDFPCIHFIIQILCTLPVSTATPERSFSTLKWLKTDLRSTTNEVDNEYRKIINENMLINCI